ncbi:DUF5330 domain-containing protein [Roseibium sp.]|uniref:DUF5330 domain-containing protein n=1 Tax=Roseibium sp. TaxID=1936156 RepID=UPI0032641E5C
MFFLLRTAFWLTLVLVLIPLGSDTESDATENIDPIAAYFAAQATVADLGGFCERNPGACETGGNALSAIGARARDGARIVYEFLDTQVADTDVAETKTGLAPVEQDHSDLITGSTSSGTLTSQDMVTPWQGNETSAFSPTFEIGPVPRPNPRAG